MRLGPFVAVIASALLVACASAPREVAITAKAPTIPSSIGAGVTVALYMVDGRDDPTIGYLGVGHKGADITASGVIPAIKREITRSLEARNFTVVDAAKGADTEFAIKLSALKFFMERDVRLGAEYISVVMDVQAEKAGGAFARSYRFSRQLPIGIAPQAGAKINAALSLVLAEIMTDSELIEFLAGGYSI